MSIIIPPPLVPLAGVALVAIVTLLTRRRSTKSYGAHAANRELEGSASDAVPRRSVTGLVTMAWELGLLLFLALWCHFGLVPVSLRQVALVSAVFTAGALLGLARDRVFGWLDAAEKEGGTGFASFVAALLRFAPLLSATLFAQLALELPWNPEVLGVAPQWLALEFALTLLLVICAYLLTQRTGIGPQLVIAFFTVIGLAEYFVVSFKYSSILPSDIFGLGTAADVAGGFEYVLNEACLTGLCAGAIGVALAAYARPRLRVGENRVKRVLVNLLLAALVAGVFVAAVTVPDYASTFGLVRSYWSSFIVFRQQGFLPSFVNFAQDLSIKKPVGYSKERAEEIQASFVENYESGRGQSASRVAAQEQFEEELPSVVVIMNETFSDLSVLDGVHAGYTGPDFFTREFTDVLAKGVLGVSTLGGGTCNTEFEMLTGISIGYVGMGKYPYSQYGFSDVDTLPRQFSSLGYATTAIHPAIASNWHRDYTYTQMGFDRFLDLSAFADPPLFHGHPTDRSTYELVLEALADKSAPQFVFDVTIQNHSGYDQNNIPEELLTSYEPSDVDNPELTAQLNEFLTCIDASDADLEWFVSQLKALDRKVVLVFFGDHQPAFSGEYNDLFFTGEDDVTHQARIYQTVYAVWANYEVAGWDGNALSEEMGADTLAAFSLDLVGAPLTDHQKAQLALHEELPVVSGIGYKDAAGAWWGIGSDGPSASLYDDLCQICYMTFGSKV